MEILSSNNVSSSTNKHLIKVSKKLENSSLAVKWQKLATLISNRKNFRNGNCSSEFVFSDSDQLVEEDLVAVIEDLLSQCRPSTLWGIELQRKGVPKGWNDVGGLNEVRRSLLQTLQWPSKVGLKIQGVPFQICQRMVTQHRVEN